MKRVFVFLSLLLLIVACEPRIKDTLPGDPNGNILTDAEKALETKDQLKDTTKEQVGNTIEDTVENTVSDIIGGSIGKKIGEIVGDQAGKAAETKVEQSFGPEFAG